MTTRRQVLSGIAAAGGLVGATESGFAINVEHKSDGAVAKTARIAAKLGKASLELTDVASGRPLTLPGKAPLFELVLANTDGSETILSSSRATDMRISTDGDGKALRLEFVKLEDMLIDVVCDISEGENGALNFGAIIRNGGDLPVRALHYPIVALNQEPGDEDTFLLMPMLETFGLIRNPHHYLPSPYPSSFKYLRETGLFGRSPGNLSAQFSAYYDGQCGLYTAAYDSKGWRKELAMDMAGGAVRMTWTHFFPEILSKETVVDYPIVFTTFQGDWHDAADIYKEWAHKQPWCAKTLAKREDVPEWIKRGSLWMSLENWAKLPDGSFKYYGDNLEKLMAKWETLLPQPPVLHYRWVEKYAYGATFLDWKPFFPSDAAYTETLPAQKKHGVRAWMMINGYNLTLSISGGKAPDERERFMQEAAPYAVKGPKGEINHWQLSWIPGGDNVEMCRGTDWAQNFNNQIAQSYSEAGFSLCQMDQTIGGGGDICYAKDHNHPPGGGIWFTEAFRKQLRSIREIGLRTDPEFSLSEEGPNELFIQDLGTYQSRDYAELPLAVLPQEGQMADAWDVRVVPVFAYIYHAYIIGYTSWVGMYSGLKPVPNTEEGWETVGVTALAKSLVNGNLPGVFESVMTPETASQTKRFRMLMQHVALTGGDEKRYLLFGMMLKPPPIKTDTVSFDFLYRYKLTRAYPRVLHNAFEDASGKRAVFLVNVSDDKADCTLDLHEIVRNHTQLFECRFEGKTIVRKQRDIADTLDLSFSALEAMYIEMV